MKKNMLFVLLLLFSNNLTSQERLESKVRFNTKTKELIFTMHNTDSQYETVLRQQADPYDKSSYIMISSYDKSGKLLGNHKNYYTLKNRSSIHKPNETKEYIISLMYLKELIPEYPYIHRISVLYHVHDYILKKSDYQDEYYDKVIEFKWK